MRMHPGETERPDGRLANDHCASCPQALRPCRSRDAPCEGKAASRVSYIVHAMPAPVTSLIRQLQCRVATRCWRRYHPENQHPCAWHQGACEHFLDCGTCLSAWAFHLPPGSRTRGVSPETEHRT